MTEENSLPVVTLPAPYFEAIGMLIAHAATLELLVDHTLAVFLRTSPTIARTFTGAIRDAKRKLQILKSVHDELADSEETRKLFDPIYQKLTSAQANRSKIAHAKWGATVNDDGGQDENSEYYILWYPEGEDEAVTDLMPLSTLQGYASQLATAHQELDRYLRALNFRPGASGQHQWPKPHKVNPRRPRKK